MSQAEHSIETLIRTAQETSGDSWVAFSHLLLATIEVAVANGSSRELVHRLVDRGFDQLRQNRTTEVRA